MIIRKFLGTAVLLTILGFIPPAIRAAVPESPFRFSLVTPADHPEYIKVAARGHRSRKVLLKRRTNRNITQRFRMM